MGNAEWVIMGIVTSGSLLYAIGGTANPLGKSVRRFIMPLVLGIGAYLLGIALARCIIFTILLIGATHLGYGSSTFKRILATTALGVALLPLGTGYDRLLCVIPPLTFTFTWWASHQFNWFTHKVSELMIGGSLGVTITLLALCP